MGGMREGVAGENVGVMVEAAVSVATISVLIIAIDVSITSVARMPTCGVRVLQDVNNTGSRNSRAIVWLKIFMIPLLMYF